MGLFSSSEASVPSPQSDPNAPLEAIHKYLAGQVGKTDANALTNALATAILSRCIKEGASDVHFDPHGDMINVRFRVDGELRDQLTFSRKDFPVTAHLRVAAGFSPQSGTSFTPEDGAFAITSDGRSVRFRASSFPSIHGDKLVIRLLDMGAQTLSLDNLGFFPEDLESLKQAISSPSGIFFVCGITGGGKTTTLCSVVQTLNRPGINIMTLEDPVEYQLSRVIQSNINPKAGFTFADGLRAILRQDPNIIMLGEVRDFETAEIAMRAALTGHLIFSTIHTISATGVISRLIDMGVQPFLIMDSMIGALAQRLVRKVCPNCAVPAMPEDATVKALLAGLAPEDQRSIIEILRAPGAKFVKGKGCSDCRMSGYKGRTGIFEVLVLNKNMRQLIGAKASAADLRKTAIASGMKTLLMDGTRKAWAGLTTLEEVRKATLEI